MVRVTSLLCGMRGVSMLEQLGDIAVRLSRSPLGIIAFAFVFVYAIAGLLTWRGNFEGDERRVLV